MTYYEEDTPEKSDPVKDFLDKTPEEVRHEEMMEMLGGIFVQLSRIYDVLMIGLPGPVVSRDEVDQVHTNGDIYGSPPALSKDAWS